MSCTTNFGGFEAWRDELRRYSVTLELETVEIEALSGQEVVVEFYWHQLAESLKVKSIKLNDIDITTKLFASKVLHGLTRLCDHPFPFNIQALKPLYYEVLPYKMAKNAYTWKCPECGEENHEDPDQLPGEKSCRSCGKTVLVEPDESKTWQQARRSQ